MKNNIYTQELSKIKAPDSLLDKTVECMRSAENERVVEFMDKPKSNRRIFKFTATVAAVLAVIIGLSAVHFAGGNIDHSFVITANAAELTPKTYVEIGELESVTGGGEFIVDGCKVNEEGKFVITDSTVLNLTREFNLTVKCSGENIESITYTANNGYLTYAPDYEGFMSNISLTEDELETYNAWCSTKDFELASSCTFDYNNQPESRLDFEIPDDGVDGSFPLRASFTIFADENEYVATADESGEIDENTLYPQMFNDHADEFSVDITANYSDGSSSTQTLQFICEQTENKTILLAKLV